MHVVQYQNGIVRPTLMLERKEFLLIIHVIENSPSPLYRFLSLKPVFIAHCAVSPVEGIAILAESETLSLSEEFSVKGGEFEYERERELLTFSAEYDVLMLTLLYSSGIADFTGGFPESRMFPCVQFASIEKTLFS